RVFQTHVRTFQINQTDSAGRALTITLVGSTGKELKMTAAEFRSRINSRAGTIFFNNQLMLPSTFFTSDRMEKTFSCRGVAMAMVWDSVNGAPEGWRKPALIMQRFSTFTFPFWR
ncbi:MAG TPA: hypothetical protein PK644_11220, partial [bacterium]|nr:hypothetical protein [bacterium]